MNPPAEESALVIVSDELISYNKDWIIDSRCSNQMTGDMEKLLNYNKLQ